MVRRGTLCSNVQNMNLTIRSYASLCAFPLVCVNRVADGLGGAAVPAAGCCMSILAESNGDYVITLMLQTEHLKYVTGYLLNVTCHIQ